ncbi:kelch-like protein diablo [Adelges cooleyi]|uniref:kelch-like protein diablo n=1 Tax=Adelges cooleyi TaxID=133065 RepID=UPI00217F39F1|nr:kelch-like protein diablo [Adelges cooleyi]
MDFDMQEYFNNFYIFLKDKEFCDVTLVTDEGLQIAAHKIILASASRVFYTMFNGHFKERNENEILLKDMDFKILESIVNFIYTFKIDIKENNFEKLLMAAEMYDISGIRELCFKYIKENINLTNCVSIMKISELIQSDKEINSFCWAYILNNFTMIVNSPLEAEKLYEFPIGDVLKIIKHDDLVVDSEEKVFDFIIGWISYNTNERTHMLLDLMKCIRLPLISIEGLKRICNEPLVSNNKDFKYTFMMDMLKEMNNTKPLYTQRRVPASNIIVAINGPFFRGDSCIKYMDIKNYDDLKWKSSDHLFFFPPRLHTTMVLSENGIILAIGGVGESANYVNLIDELDLTSKSKQWVTTRPLNQPRINFAVCTYKQYIYVVGGCDFSSENMSNSVEYYDTNSKVWTEIIEPMPTARALCSSTIFSNKLYVFGGDNGNFLATVEYYDFEKKHWKKLDPMPICNYRIGISTIENVIYLVGGRRAPERVFKFDLQHYKWDEMPKMNMATYGDCSSVVIMKNDLFVFVNDGGTVHCERYDKEEKQWKLVDKAGEQSYEFCHMITFNDTALKSYSIYL